MRKPLTPEQQLGIEELSLLGVGIKEIARRVGCSRASVENYRRSLRCRSADAPRPMTPEQQREVLRRLESLLGGDDYSLGGPVASARRRARHLPEFPRTIPGPLHPSTRYRDAPAALSPAPPPSRSPGGYSMFPPGSRYNLPRNAPWRRTWE